MGKNAAPLAFSATSLKHVLASVSARRSGAAVNPTAGTVQFAAITSPPETAAPTSGDWKTASWETDATTDPDEYYAVCLIGPGGALTLAAGTYHLWLKITDSPEIPVEYSGVIRITP